MSRHEVEEALTKYGIYAGTGVTVFSDLGEIYKLCHFFNQGKLVSFERPDAYIKVENEILIIEHFAIDGYDTFNGGGSKLMRNINVLQKEFDKKEASSEGVYMTKPLGVCSSYEGFLANCRTRFDQHYDQIMAYKRHLQERSIADENTKFVVCFLMDEISPLGTLTCDGDKIHPVCLARSREFLEYFASKKEVDWVISAVNLPDGLKPYFFSQNEIDECKKSVLEYANFQFLSSNPMVTNFKISIPKEDS